MDHLKTIYRTIERALYPDVCVQCHTRFAVGLFATTKEGFTLHFCSDKCGHDYWREYGQFGRNPTTYRQPTGPRLCRLPGCSKPCYIEGGGKVHDYCGRTHAQQHGAMISPQTGRGGGGGGGGGRTTGYARQGSGGTYTYEWGDQTGPILFYNRGDPYYEFTNFYQAVIQIDGDDWLTTEHYFQAQKFVGTPLVGTIRLLERPREAFDKSRDPRYSHWRRNDWEEVKEEVMFKALQAKFTQHENLRRMLIDTKERSLVEHSPHDRYWGDGGDGSGKNRLGILLMKLRHGLTPKLPVRAPSPPPQMHHGPLLQPASIKAHQQQNSSEKQQNQDGLNSLSWPELTPQPPLSQQGRDGSKPTSDSEQLPQSSLKQSRDEHRDILAPQPTGPGSGQVDPESPDPPKGPTQIPASAPIVHSSSTVLRPTAQPKTTTFQMQKVTVTVSSTARTSPGSVSSQLGGQQPITSPVVTTQPSNDLASTSSALTVHSTTDQTQLMGQWAVAPEAYNNAATPRRPLQGYSKPASYAAAVQTHAPQPAQPHSQVPLPPASDESEEDMDTI